MPDGFVHGKFYTVNEAQPWAEAVAIKDGKFLVVGSNADVEAVTGEGTEVVDLGHPINVFSLLQEIHVQPFMALVRSDIPDGAVAVLEVVPVNKLFYPGSCSLE